VKNASTPMETQKPLLKDEDVSVCARYQVNIKVSRLYAVKRIYRYALTVNPIVYTSCIEQFWAIVKAKTVNGEGRLQALVDGKKVIITESIIRRDLQLEDAKGVDCLPNVVIFEQLTLMGEWKSFNPVPRIIANADGTSTSTISGLVNAEENA
nr:hypothetical protein [Tanacetum cinerariifolium]